MAKSWLKDIIEKGLKQGSFPTASHILGGCWKLHQSDTAVVCLTLAFPAKLHRPQSPGQHRALPHPSHQRRGAAAQDLWDRGKGKNGCLRDMSSAVCRLFLCTIWERFVARRCKLFPLCFRFTVTLKSAWTFFPTDWELQTTFLATRESIDV